MGFGPQAIVCQTVCSEYKNTVDFCIFTMYSLTMLNSLIHSSSLNIPLHFLHTQSCHLQIMTFLALPFQSLNLLFIYLFSCLTGLTRTSRTTLHEIRQFFCFIPYLKGKAFIIPPLCV